MKRVQTFPNLPEARLIADALERQGISVKVFNEFAQGGMGDIPFQHAWPEVWVVNDEDYPRAEALARNLRQPPASGPERACPACGETNPGNFGLCWRCGASLEGS